MAILTPPLGLNPWPRDHEFHNLGMDIITMHLIFFYMYRSRGGDFLRFIYIFSLCSYWPCPRTWSPVSAAMNFTILVKLHWYHNSAFSFSKEEGFFESLACFLFFHILPCPWCLVGGKVIKLTVYITLILEMLQIKNGNNLPCIF